MRAIPEMRRSMCLCVPLALHLQKAVNRFPYREQTDAVLEHWSRYISQLQICCCLPCLFFSYSMCIPVNKMLRLEGYSSSHHNL